MFDIVSFGDPVTLTQVFNSIAAISANTTYKAAASALALFVFAAAMLASMAEGKQELPIPRLLAAFFLYVAGFTTLTNVSIENRYDGTVSSIYNIPIAIAVPASLFSNIGFELSELVETAFGNVDEFARVSERGYLSPLAHIAAYRNVAQQTCPLGEANSLIKGVSTCTSLANYIRDCASVKAKRDGLTQTMKEGDFLESIRFDSEAFTTVIVNGSKVEQAFTCKDAYKKISDAIRSTDFESSLNSQKGVLGLRDTDDVIDSTSAAMAAITADSGRARSLIQTAFYLKMAEQGEYSFLVKNGGSDLAENLNTSINKRNYEWALQGEMWVQIVNKFITIIEAILYAITPFIGLLAICGSVGAKSLMLYLQMLGIIQLIPPMLVVTQNIILSQLERTLAVLEASYSGGSIIYLIEVLNETQELMGIGGMIAATVVPALAMALVTGSGMAVMGAFKGAAAAPKDSDAMAESANQGGSIENLSSLNAGSRDAFGNVWTESGAQRVGEISRSLASASNVGAAKSSVEEAQTAYSKANANLLQTANQKASSAEQVQSVGRNVASSSETMQSFLENTVKEITNGQSITDSEMSVLTNALGGNLALGAGKKFAENNEGKSGSSIGFDSKHLMGLNKDIVDSFREATTGTSGESLSAKYQETLQVAESKNEKVTAGDSELDAQTKAVQSAKSELEKTQESYSLAQSTSDTVGLLNSDFKGTIATTAKNQEVQDYIAEKYQSGQNEEWNKIFSNHQAEFSGGVNGMNLDHDSAMLSSFIAANHLTGDHTDTLKVLSFNDANQVNTPEQLIDAQVAPDNKVGNTPHHGDLNREDIIEPQKGNIKEAPTLNVDKELAELTENNPLSIELMNHNAESFQKNSQLEDRSNRRFDAESGEIRNRSVDTHHFIQDSMQRIGNSISDYLGVDNGIELAKETYAKMQESWNNSTVGQVVDSTLGKIENGYDAMTTAIEKFGEGSTEAKNAEASLFEDTKNWIMSNLDLDSASGDAPEDNPPTVSKLEQQLFSSESKTTTDNNERYETSEIPEQNAETNKEEHKPLPMI